MVRTDGLHILQEECWEPCTGYQSRRELKHFCPLHVCFEITKEDTTLSGTGWDDALLTEKRGRAGSVPYSKQGPPTASTGQLPMHTLLGLHWKDFNLSPVESKITEARSVHEDCRYTHLRRTREHSLCLKQGKICPHERRWDHTGCADSVISW